MLKSLERLVDRAGSKLADATGMSTYGEQAAKLVDSVANTPVHEVSAVFERLGAVMPKFAAQNKDSGPDFDVVAARLIRSVGNTDYRVDATNTVVAALGSKRLLDRNATLPLVQEVLQARKINLDAHDGFVCREFFVSPVLPGFNTRAVGVTVNRDEKPTLLVQLGDFSAPSTVFEKLVGTVYSRADRPVDIAARQINKLVGSMEATLRFKEDTIPSFPMAVNNHREIGSTWFNTTRAIPGWRNI